MTVPTEIKAKIAAIDFFTAPQNITPLGGGITNVNLTVEEAGRKYVVRLGDDIPEHGVMRWNELAIARAAAQAELTPSVRYAAPGVMVIDFIEAAPLSAEALQDPKVLVPVTEMIRQCHQAVPGHLIGPVLSFHVFHILRSYAGFLRSNGSSHVPLLDDLMAQATYLEKAVGPVELVLGHNDLLPANILQGADRFWLIDWEYGGFNSPLFDLGGLATNAALSPEAEALMLKTYFGAAPGADFLRRYEAMKCASLMRETLWSMVSEITSKIDFDYAEYTQENLAAYQAAFDGQFSG